MTHTKKLLFFLSPVAFLLPRIAYAAPGTFAELVNLLIGLINPAASILGSIAVCIFLWGIVKYIWSAGDEGHEQGRTLILWGLVGLFVMVGVWGLARVVISVFFGEGGGSAAP